MSGVASAIILSGALGAGASVFGGLAQRSATNRAISAQMNMFNQIRGEAQPFITAGQGAAGTLSNLLTPGANMSGILQNIPGFNFISKLAQQGVSNQGTVTGLGGNTLLAGANAGANVALSQGWQPIVQSLLGLEQGGTGALGTLSGLAGTTGTGVASSTIQGGNAIAGSAMGAANNIGGGVLTYSLLDKLLKGGGLGGATSEGMYGNNLINVAGGGQIPMPPMRTV